MWPETISETYLMNEAKLVGTVIPHIIVTGQLGEGDFMNESYVTTIICNIFPFRLPIVIIYRIYSTTLGSRGPFKPLSLLNV